LIWIQTLGFWLVQKSIVSRFGYRIMRCEVCQQTIMLDMTWQDCAATHRCAIDECPNRDRFIGECSVTVGDCNEASDEDVLE
jgi:hypothetical protein